MGRNVHVRCSKRIRKYPQRYDPVFGVSIEWWNDDVAIIVYMIQDRYLNRNVDTNDKIYSLDEWYEEYCMYMS